MVKPQEAKKGFVLLPKRRVVERSFAWTARFRRLTRDSERLADALKGFLAASSAAPATARGSGRSNPRPLGDGRIYTDRR